MTNIAEISIHYKPEFKMNQLPKISCSEDVYNILSQDWEDVAHLESFKVLLLNRAHKVLGLSTVGKGGVTGTVADPKIVFQTALKANATSMIIAHNHPSGNLQPSDNDKRLTNKLVNAGKLMEIQVLDHIIVSDSSYFSFADEGIL